jgi:hypothetical protein
MRWQKHRGNLVGVLQLNNVEQGRRMVHTAGAAFTVPQARAFEQEVVAKPDTITHAPLPIRTKPEDKDEVTREQILMNEIMMLAINQQDGMKLAHEIKQESVPAVDPRDDPAFRQEYEAYRQYGIRKYAFQNHLASTESSKFVENSDGKERTHVSPYGNGMVNEQAPVENLYDAETDNEKPPAKATTTVRARKRAREVNPTEAHNGAAGKAAKRRKR